MPNSCISDHLGHFSMLVYKNIYMVGQSTSIYYLYIVPSLQLKMYCLNIINPIAMGTVWRMVLMMPLIMMMAISTNRSLAWAIVDCQNSDSYLHKLQQNTSFKKHTKSSSPQVRHIFPTFPSNIFSKRFLTRSLSKWKALVFELHLAVNRMGSAEGLRCSGGFRSTLEAPFCWWE